MDPISLTLGLVGAGGAGLAGIFGASAADRAADMNWQINLLNYYQREREREDAMRTANQARHDNQLGVTDARGNRTRFVQGVGWVTENAPGTQDMMNLQDAEQKAVLTKDLPLRRNTLERNYKRQLGEEALADTFKRQLTGLQRGDDRPYEDAIYRASVSGVKDAMDDSDSLALTHALRTDSSNIGKVVQGLSTARSNALSKASADAKLKSMGMADEQYGKDRSGLANLYNMFAARAQAMPDVSYKPQSVDTGASQSVNPLLSGQRSLDTLATQVSAMKGGTLDYIQPNYGWANAIGGGAGALASALKLQNIGGFGDAGGTSSYTKTRDRYVGNE